jgi:hypothetical protein
MKRALVIGFLLVAHVAVAAPSNVLVLRAEGTADASTRTSVDTHVLRLAKHIEGKVEPGEITLTEAAALVGCDASEASCKDNVLTVLAVDEIVATTVTATPTGFNVTVRRITAGSAPRAAQTTIASGQSPDVRLDTDIGPLFGIVAQPAAAAVEERPAEPAPAPPGTNPPPPTLAPADTSTAPIGNGVTAAPNGAITPPAEGAPKSRRLQKIGMGVGGGLVLLGFIMWSQASDVQGQIDEKPEPRTPADFQDLRDLEKKGDDLAGAGNLFFLAGAVLGGVSAYYYIKIGKAQRAQTARIAPTAFPHGAGVTLTIGGAP